MGELAGEIGDRRGRRDRGSRLRAHRRARDAPPPFAAWTHFVDGLRDLAPRMQARLPERLRHDPQVQQELGQLMLQALASRAIDTISADGDHPVFLPSPNITLNVFQPNADTTYRTAYITPGGTYRLARADGVAADFPGWGSRARR